MEKLYLNQINNVTENYKFITEEIANSALKSGKTSEDITFLAATKTVDVQVINHAISLGLNAIGENRVQELLSKYDEYNLTNCDLQFIGTLQRNKIKNIIDKVSQIQSIYTIDQVKEVSKLSEKLGIKMPILIEVNIGKEESKGGVMPEAILEFIDEARLYSGVKINGLMTIPPICDNKIELMQFFSLIHKYFIDIEGKKMDNVYMNCLSMGMSSDYNEAILCGANMVRIGSSLFGARQY